jgi:hypothetical protein
MRNLLWVLPVVAGLLLPPHADAAKSKGCKGSCTVSVKPYKKKDGTKVKQHKRNAPGTAKKKSR